MASSSATDDSIRGATRADAVELAVLVGLDLPVDLVLHRRGLAHVGERLPPALAGRLDHQVAGPQHPLEDRLGEQHVVDPVERDLDAATCDSTPLR